MQDIGPIKNSFIWETMIYTMIAEMITFFEAVLDRTLWVMSPSRAYRALYYTIEWFRSRNVWHFGQPAFFYVIEQLKARADKLDGTSVDLDLEMEMTMWRDRKPPIAGGTKSVLYIFDWFLPILRTIESKMVQFFGNPEKSAGGKEFSKFEALDIVFNAVDKLYKDPHFGSYNAWGWPVAYPWVKFVRDEMFEWHESLKPRAPKPEPGSNPPFSG